MVGQDRRVGRDTSDSYAPRRARSDPDVGRLPLEQTSCGTLRRLSLNKSGNTSEAAGGHLLHLQTGERR